MFRNDVSNEEIYLLFHRSLIFWHLLFGKQTTLRRGLRCPQATACLHAHLRPSTKMTIPSQRLSPISRSWPRHTGCTRRSGSGLLKITKSLLPPKEWHCLWPVCRRLVDAFAATIWQIYSINNNHNYYYRFGIRTLIKVIMHLLFNIW